MTPEIQQEAINLLAEASQRLGNASQGKLSQKIAHLLMQKINNLLEKIEDKKIEL